MIHISWDCIESCTNPAILDIVLVLCYICVRFCIIDQQCRNCIYLQWKGKKTVWQDFSRLVLTSLFMSAIPQFTKGCKETCKRPQEPAGQMCPHWGEVLRRSTWTGEKVCCPVPAPLRQSMSFIHFLWLSLHYTTIFVQLYCFFFFGCIHIFLFFFPKLNNLAFLKS